VGKVQEDGSLDGWVRDLALVQEPDLPSLKEGISPTHKSPGSKPWENLSQG
jgi:hypothetical protein